MKYLNKTIEYGLYLLVFLLPIQTRWIIKAGELNSGYLEYGTYSLYGTDILLILLLLLFVVREIAASPAQGWLLAMTEERLPHRNGKVIWWFIGGLLLMSAVSVFFAVDKLLALYKLGWLISGVGLFCLAARANYSKLKLIYAMLAGVFLQAFLGSWQFLSQSSLANKWLGLAWHNASDLGTSVIEAVGADGAGERWLRAYGGLDHPNMLGGVMAIGILLLIGQMIKFGKIPNPNDQYPVKSQIPMTNIQVNYKFIVILKYINWLLLPVFTTALFFSFSRSAWLALTAGLGVMLILAVAGKDYKMQKGLAEIILAMGILLFILFNQYQNLIISRISGEGRLENKSTSERLVSYQESWQMIKKTPAAGVGLGNYTSALSRRVPNQESFYYQPAHNVFMLVWSEVGIVGLLFFIGLLIVIARRLVLEATRQSLVELRVREIASLPSVARNDKKEYAPRNDKDGWASRNDRMGYDSIILIALIVMMSFDHWLWSLHFGVLFFWLVLGLAANNKRDENSGFPPARE